VTINRREKQVDIDRLDMNWWDESPFIGRRDHFYVEERGGTNSHNGELTFVRHDMWLFTLLKPFVQNWSFLSAMSYKRAFAAQPSL